MSSHTSAHSPEMAAFVLYEPHQAARIRRQQPLRRALPVSPFTSAFPRILALLFSLSFEPPCPGSRNPILEPRAGGSRNYFSSGDDGFLGSDRFREPSSGVSFPLGLPAVPLDHGQRSREGTGASDSGNRCG